MQTTYSLNPDIGLAGMISSGRPSDIDTRVAEGAIVPGYFVIAGTGQHEARVPAATFVAAAALGIALLDSPRVVQAYADNEGVPVLRSGCVWVQYEVDTVPVHDTPLYVRHTANGAGRLIPGVCRANTDTGAVLVAGAFWRRINTAAGIAELELNLA